MSETLETKNQHEHGEMFLGVRFFDDLKVKKFRISVATVNILTNIRDSENIDFYQFKGMRSIFIIHIKKILDRTLRLETRNSDPK